MRKHQLQRGCHSMPHGSSIKEVVFIPTYSKETALYDTLAIKNDIDAASNKADAYMTDVSSNGVFVHKYDETRPGPSSPGANGVHIHSNVDIIRNGQSVASYGETTRIGKENQLHCVYTGDGQTYYARRSGAVDGSEYDDIVFGYTTHTVPGAERYHETCDVTVQTNNLIYTNAAHEFINDGSFNDLSSINQATLYYTDENDSLFVIDMIENGQRVYPGMQGYWGNDGYGVLIFHVSVLTDLFGSDFNSNNLSVLMDYSTNGVIYHPQMWMGNRRPLDDIRFQINRDDNILGFSIDKDGKIATPQIQSGTTGNVTVDSGTYKDVQVYFTPPMSSTPTVIVSLHSTSISSDIGYISAASNNESADGFTIRIFNAGPYQRIPVVNWLAINI